MLPDPVPRDGERVLARWGLLGEGAAPVFAAGARYPLAGLLLALPALEGTGLLGAARQVYGQLRDGCCGLGATLLTLVFLALAGEPRAEGATRVPPAALGRVLGLDRAPEVKTIRRKLGELAAAGKAADLIMALARRHAAARPDTLGFLHVDGHARVFADITEAGFGLLTWRKGPAPDLPAEESPPSPAPMTAADGTSTSSRTRPRSWASARGRARARPSRCGRSPSPAGSPQRAATPGRSTY